MTKRFGGRPRLPHSQIRNQRVVTFVTSEESRLLNQIAREQGASISRVCHELIVSALRAENGKQRKQAASGKERKDPSDEPIRNRK